MKKINEVIGFENLHIKSGREKKLTQAEIEYEFENCPAPWKCSRACYNDCIGCLQKRLGGEQ